MNDESDRIGCLGVLLGLVGIKLPEAPAKDRLPYRTQASLLTPAERSFYGVLQRTVGERAIVFAKVRVGDLLHVPRGKGMMAHLNRINSKHVDFVLCAPDTVRPIAAIELDDSSHDRPDRVSRDDFLNAAFEAAGLPLIRFAVRHQYEVRDIEKKIEAALAQPSTPVSAATVEPSGIPNCPTCETPMILRTASSGPKRGSSFYGCSNFPKCREIVPVENQR